MKISAAIFVVLLASVAHAQTAKNGFAIQVISTRADLVSGGDALVQIAVPATVSAGRLAVTANGRDVSGAFKLGSKPNTFLGLVSDLPNGRSEIQAGVRGEKPSASLAIVGHPIAGPVMSGPHQNPFICETQAFGFGQPLDADCAVATRVEYFYRSNAAPAGPS